MKSSDLLSLANELESEATARTDHYDELEAAYGGYYPDRKKDGFWKKVAGKLFPSYDRSDEERITIVINLIRPIVEAKRSFIGQIPSVRVPPPDSSDEAQILSDLAEKAILGFWQFSDIGKRMSDMGFYCSLYGTAVGMVWPDIKEKKPRLLIRSPRDFYPMPKDDDGREMRYVIFKETYDGREADAMWPGHGYAPRDEVKVVRYIDEVRMQVIDEDSVELTNIEHNLGFCPVKTIANIGVPGSPFGDSDVENAIELQKAVNRRYALMENVAERTAYPLTVIRGGQDVPDVLPTGPDAYIEVGPQGGIEQVFPPQMGESFWMATQQLEQKINVVTDTPSLLTADYQGAVGSGKGVNATLSPNAARMEIRQNAIYPSIQQLNKFAILMWHKFPKFNRQQQVFGKQRGGSFEIDFKPEELKWDGEVWTKNEVYLDSAAYIDRQANFIATIQAVQNRLMSRRRAMELSPYVDDVTEEEKRIKAETEADLAAAQAQTMMQQATPTPEMGEPTRTAYGLERGYMGETVPAPPAGMENTPMPEEEEPTGEFDINELVELIGEVKNLKGRVWIVGGALQGDISLGIELFVENGLDKQTIINHVGKVLPEFVDTKTGNGELVFHTGTPPQEMESVEVTGSEEMQEIETPQPTEEDLAEFGAALGVE